MPKDANEQLTASDNARPRSTRLAQGLLLGALVVLFAIALVAFN